MAIDWRLQEVMAAKGIGNASQLHTAFENQLGIQISRTALAKLVKKHPVQIRLETAQYLCTLFQVPLEELLVITPETLIRHPVLIQPFGRQSSPASALMVDPGQFF